MPLDQRYEHEEPHVLPEPVTRNVHGVSLEDARKAFRAEWEVKVRQKRQELEDAQRRALWWGKAQWWILVRGLGCGGCLVGFGGLLLHGLPMGLLASVAGAIAGGLAAVPLAILCWMTEIWFQKQAERLERQLWELERA